MLTTKRSLKLLLQTKVKTLGADQCRLLEAKDEDESKEQSESSDCLSTASTSIGIEVAPNIISDKAKLKLTSDDATSSAIIENVEDESSEDENDEYKEIASIEKSRRATQLQRSV